MKTTHTKVVVAGVAGACFIILAVTTFGIGELFILASVAALAFAKGYPHLA